MRAIGDLLLASPFLRRHGFAIKAEQNDIA
jgi:hypothetical protein